MAAALGIPEDEMQKVTDVISDFTGKFSLFMVIGFKDTIIAQKKAEKEPSEESQEQLEEPPVPDWVIKTGQMSKTGADGKGFKPRFFKALNAADNYKIEYFTNAQMTSKKGEVQCAGYKAKKNNDVKKSAITLEPDDPTRRVWHFACANDEERDEWLGVFETACSNASAPKDPDELLQSAFEIAFNKLKSDRRVWWYLPFDRPIPEMLARLLSIEIERDIMNGLLDKVSPPIGVLKSYAQKTVRRMVATQINTACNVGWNGAKQTIDSVKGTVVSAIEQAVDPIISAQMELKTNVTDAISSVTNPVTAEINERMIAPLLARCVTPLTAVFQAAIRGWHEKTSDAAQSLSGADTREDTYRELMSNIGYSYYSRSPMVEAYQLLRDFEDGDLAEFASALSGVSVWRFVWKIDDAVRVLLRKATYTIYKAVCDGADVTAALGETVAKLVNDAKLAFTAMIQSGMVFMFGDFIDENLVSPCVELVQPIADLVPEPLKELLDIVSLLEETLNAVIDGMFGEAATGACTDALPQLDGWQG